MSCRELKQKFLAVPMRCLSSAIIFALFFSLQLSSGFATWRLIAHFQNTVNSSFFFNEQRGFVGIDGIFGIKRTYDGGQNWFDCSIPPGYDGIISDIFMKDSLNGWAGVDVPYNGPINGLWYTSDGGVTWNESNAGHEITSVYETSSAIICGSRYFALAYSTTKGAVFSPSKNDDYNGINFTDDLHGVASEYRSAFGNNYPPASWTSDGGLTWSQSQGIAEEAWGVYAEKGTSNFYIAGEKTAGDRSNWENVYKSTDYGMTFNPVGQIQERTTGHVGGSGHVIYVESDISSNGMLRSTDGGVTWVNVGGPNNFRDTRFSVMGCLGGIVYAFDIQGNVWKTNDGGNGDIHELPHNPNVIPDHLDLSADLCHDQLANLYYNNLSCDSLNIVSIQFIDSTDPAVASGALSFTKYPTLPQVIAPTKADYLTLSWQPVKMGVAKPLSTTYIKIHSTMLGETIIMDTLIAVNSQSFGFIPSFSLSAANVKFDSLNMCSRFIDTTLSFTNQSCDSLWLDSANLSASGDWQVLDLQTMLPIVLPIGLAPSETASFIVEFMPSIIGAQKANLKLHFIHQGLSKDTSLSFSGISYRIVQVSADPNIAIAPTSICASIDTVISFHNLNCDTLTIDDILNNNSAIFSDITGATFPLLLPPGATFNYRVHYNALKNVTSGAGITFLYHLGQDSGVVRSTISGKGIPGASAFQTTVSTSQLAFTDKVACSPQDSLVFMISNPGCDTLTVLNSSISFSQVRKV